MWENGGGEGGCGGGGEENQLKLGGTGLPEGSCRRLKKYIFELLVIMHIYYNFDTKQWGYPFIFFKSDFYPEFFQWSI